MKTLKTQALCKLGREIGKLPGSVKHESMAHWLVRRSSFFSACLVLVTKMNKNTSTTFSRYNALLPPFGNTRVPTGQFKESPCLNSCRLLTTSPIECSCCSPSKILIILACKAIHENSKYRCLKGTIKKGPWEELQYKQKPICKAIS